MAGKVKSLHGVYKALGREAFLAAAIYSDNVQNTVEATLSVMENSWYNTKHTLTEATKMVDDYNKGFLTRASANALLEQIKLQKQFASNINAVLFKVNPVRLENSLKSSDKEYAGEVLKQMHNAFVKTYGTDYLEGGKYEFVQIPAVISSRNNGKLCLGIVTLDLQSSGEHWGTDFITPYGMMAQGDPDADERAMKYVRENFYPYDYWYTADVENDIHVSFDNVPEDVAELLDIACSEKQSDEYNFTVKM